MKTFTNSVKYRNPQTNDFETLPGLVGPGGGVHVGAKEPTNTNVNVWVTTEKENYYEIPEINDETISSEDTWSSARISKGDLGVNNSEAQMPISASWSSVAYGNGIYVAITNEDNTTNIAYNNNGIKWNIVSLQENQHWNNITYGNGKFVAISSEGAAICSEDGITWNYTTLPHTSSEETTFNWVNVAYGNGKFVACYYYSRSTFGSYTNRSVYSNDGITWELGQSGATTSGHVTSLIYGNNKFIAPLTNGKIWYADENGTSFDIQLEAGLNPAQYDKISYGNGKFVVCSSSVQDVIFYSDDGLAWTSTSNTAYYYNSLTYGNGNFIAQIKNSDRILYSHDAITWNYVTLPIDRTYEAIAHDGNKFIAIAKDSTDIIFSKNGINWDTKSPCLSQNEENVTSQVHEALNISTNYCLGEVLTGDTWIDGKPIYRFIWQGTTSLSGEQGVVCRLPEGHFDTVFTLRGMFKRTSDNSWFAIPNIYYGAISWAVNIRTDLSTDEPDGILLGFGSQYTGSRPIIIIAEYTKS